MLHTDGCIPTSGARCGAARACRTRMRWRGSPVLRILGVADCGALIEHWLGPTWLVVVRSQLVCGA